jgi:predicted HD phosphohydrolase
MTSAEAVAFAQSPFAEGAVRLRRWDDRGKVDGLDVPPLSTYLAAIARLAR